MNDQSPLGRIRRVEERLAYSDPDNPWVRLYYDRVEFPDGNEGSYNRIVEGLGHPGIAILPISDGHIGLVHQYRYPVGEKMWEIPRGFGDSANPQREAVRELLEETGIEVNQEELVDLGVVHPNSGLLATEAHLYAVEVNDPRTAQSTDGQSEQEFFRWFEVGEVLNRISAGSLTDAFTICAILKAKQSNLL